MNTKNIIGWDVDAWSIILKHWKNYIAQHVNWTLGLELGANRGGLTAFFLSNTNVRFVCSDFPNKPELAIDLHSKLGVCDRVFYEAVDAAQIQFPDNYYDLVCFKSILGVVGSNGDNSRQEKAIDEIMRVLKPCGVLFFAENLKASILHELARRYFIPWGRAWNYPSLKELRKLTNKYDVIDIKVYGFFSAFVRKEGLIKRFLVGLDKVLVPIIPPSQRYIVSFIIRK